MLLKELIAELSPTEREFLLGLEGVNPLTHGFFRKRVVHAGLNGKMVNSRDAAGIWDTILNSKPKKKQAETAYIHIPFCKTKCLYCGFFQNGSQQKVEDAYIDRLIKEMESEMDKPRLKDTLISTVFIGGGTPTSLSPANAKRLLETIKKCLPLTNDYELTLEGRIHDLVPEKMDIWMKGGVNRMSLGVQSFNTEVRQKLGRLDDEETIIKNLTALHDYQQCAVVIDLIFGLPGQTAEVWEHDLECLTAAPIDGADLYQLNVFEGSDLNKAIASGKIGKAATTAEQAEMFAFAHKYLTQRAYKRLSICHWAKNSRERSMYNSMAKAGTPMFCYGCGAGGTLNGYAAMNQRALPAYNALIDSGKKPIMALIQENPLSHITRLVTASLECGALDIKKLAAFDSRLSELDWLYKLWEKRGFVRYNGYQYELTLAGQFWQINITQSTLECIQSLLTGKNTLAVQKIAAQEGATDEKRLKMLHAHKHLQANKMLKGAPDAMPV